MWEEGREEGERVEKGEWEEGKEDERLEKSGEWEGKMGKWKGGRENVTLERGSRKRIERMGRVWRGRVGRR